MDVVASSIFLSSLTSAALFYAGGRLSRRGAPEAQREAPEPATGQRGMEPDPGLHAELEAERAARARAEEQASGGWRAHEEAVAALAEQRARSAAVREELAGERARWAAVRDELAGERTRLAAVRAELAGERQARARADADAAKNLHRLGEEGGRQRAQAADLAAQVATLRAKVALEGGELARTRTHLQAAEARAMAAELRAVEVGADLEKAGADLAKAGADLAKALRSLAGAPDLAEVQRRSLEVSMKLRALEQRSAEIDAKDAENTQLRRMVSALTASADEADELRRRLRDLEAQGFARRLTLPGLFVANRDEIPESEGKPELEANLVANLRDLALRERGCRVAVLSDFRGLLVAAYGERDHRHELAAAASLTTSTAERLRELLPMGESASLIVVDENDVVFRTQWLRWEGECFLLSTLGAAPPEADAATEALRARLSELIGGA